MVRAHWHAIAGDMRRWQEDGTLPELEPLDPPPGDPFGDDDPSAAVPVR